MGFVLAVHIQHHTFYTVTVSVFSFLCFHPRCCVVVTGGYIPPHSTTVRELEIQNSAGRVSAEHYPQLGQRVQEMAEQLGTG